MRQLHAVFSMLTIMLCSIERTIKYVETPINKLGLFLYTVHVLYYRKPGSYRVVLFCTGMKVGFEEDEEGH